MGRKPKDQGQEPPQGEQLELIDVGPENVKQILPVAREYKNLVRQRVALTAKEKELKEQIKSFVHESGLKALPDGSFRFKCDGVLVEVIPSDEKVHVKEDTEN